MNANRESVVATAVLLCLLGAVAAKAGYQPGAVVAWGSNTYGQTNVPGDLTNAVALAVGYGHSLAVRVDGTVVAWGDNTHGQTNVPTDLTNVISLAGGAGHSLALKADGTVAAWGSDYQNVAGTWTPTSTPTFSNTVIGIAAGMYHSLALQTNGTVVAWGKYPGDSGWYAMTVPTGLSNVVAIAADAFSCLALRSDSTIVYWGSRVSPGTHRHWGGLSNVIGIALGGQYEYALDTSGTVFRWNLSTSESVMTNILLIAGGLGITADRRAVNLPGIYSAPAPANLTNVVAIADRGSHRLATTLAPVMTLAPVAQIALPSGASTNLSVGVMSATAYVIQWYFNGSLVSSGIQTNLSISSFNLAQAGAYSIAISNQLGYAVTVTSVLRLTNSPVVFVDGVDVGGGKVERVDSAQIIMSSTFGADANTYYTLDGSPPDFTDTPYTGPFTLTHSATIRAVAYNSAYTQSAEAAPITVQITPTYSLTASTPGGGSLSFSPSPYSGGNRFVSNTLVTVAATPSNGWSFLGWLGDASGSSPVAAALMSRDMAVEALFGTTLGSNVLGAGQIQFSPQVPVYPFGATVGVTAVPQTGNYLMNWAGALSGSNNPNTF